jgi:hypothetical protein
LSSPSANAALTTPSTTTVTIADNDTAGTVQFSAASFSFVEDVGVATLTVTRTGGAASGVTVPYSTADGSATEADGDYTASSSLLSFGAGQTSATFTIPITDDGEDEGNETFQVTLGVPTGGALPGSPATATVFLLDDDP